MRRQLGRTIVENPEEKRGKSSRTVIGASDGTAYGDCSSVILSTKALQSG